MKLSEYIKELQKLESDGRGDLEVCLADWSENYRSPAASSSIYCIDGGHMVYTIDEGMVKKDGLFIQLGDD